MSRKKKKSKQIRCFVCNSLVPKKDTAFLYNSRTIRYFCTSHVENYDPSKNYFWDKEKEKLVEGYTQSELREMRRAQMTPEELKRDDAKRKSNAAVCLSMLSSFEHYRRPNLPF